jgi:hypothetical protein
MDSAFCVVEYNLFERTEGENEGAICHKSCNNIIRYNTFGERSEEMSLRHGNNDRADRVKIVCNTIIDCESGYQMPGRNNGLGATNITFAGNLIKGGAPVSISGSYTDPVWKGNIIWQTSGGDMPASGYRTEEINENQPFFMKNPDPGMYPDIPLNNRPLTPSEVGPFAQ